MTHATPFDALGGEATVRKISEAFYQAVEQHEPALVAMHRLDEDGRIQRQLKDAFTEFLIAWLGGPPDYFRNHGPPALPMRHRSLAIDQAMVDAWLRAMTRALDGCEIEGRVRDYLDRRFHDVATLLRNRD